MPDRYRLISTIRFETKSIHLSEEPQKDLRIALGGEVLSFVASDRNADFALGDTYRAFESSAEPDLSFRVHPLAPARPSRGKMVFETDRWFLDLADHLTINIRHPYFGVYQQIELKPDAAGGDVYRYDAPWGDDYRRHILIHPAGEVLFLTLLAQERGVLLHASAAGDRGQGILFSGMSGAGKSTLIKLWQDHTDATLLSDDRIIVRKRDGQFWAYGTPWHGSVPVISPEAFPLERIFVIHHADKNKVAPLSPSEAMKDLLIRSFPPFWDAQAMNFTLGFLDSLTQSVPCYRLGFVPDRSAVDFIQWSIAP